jgi:hypothetical protein
MGLWSCEAGHTEYDDMNRYHPKTHTSTSFVCFFLAASVGTENDGPRKKVRFLYTHPKAGGYDDSYVLLLLRSFPIFWREFTSLLSGLAEQPRGSICLNETKNMC